MSDPHDELPPEVVERPGGLLSRLDPHLVLYHDPRSLHAEQFRAFRTNLIAMNRDGAPWAIVITSSRKGEGKSIGAANLAACLAELPGSKVCLVDVDFRAPAQSEIFGIKAETGVTELVESGGSLSAVVRETIVPDLDLLPTGREPDSPAELLGGERFANVIRELRRRYSWILIDTPPVNPYTDACTLAGSTNGALVVVRMSETAKDLVERAVSSIRSAGGRVLGTFLTGLSTDRDDADRAGYYRYETSESEASRLEEQREKNRRRTGKRLRKQERAWMKRRDAAERRVKSDEEEPLV